MHNLGTVLEFEIIRTLKKKSFWLMALGFPLILAGVFAIIYFSGKATNDASEKLIKQSFSFAVKDDSGLIKDSVIAAVNAERVTDKSKAIEGVKNGTLDGFVYYPKDLSNQSIEVYGKDVGIFDNSRYEAVANSMLKNSVSSGVTAAESVVLREATKQSVTTYREGEPYNPLMEAIAPGIFLVMFYMLIAFFGGQMLTSTTEEKENRVIEMILTTVKAKTLIIGKIVSLVILAFLQALIILVPIVVIYFGFRDDLSLPQFDLASLPIDPVRMIVGAVLFLSSFMLFTGLLVLVGAMVPSAKEANQFFGIFMVMLFGPLYAVTLFVSSPESPLVRFLSLFPLTAPIPLLLRNAIGNLEPWEIIAALVILTLSAIVVLTLAVRVFRFGALEYSRKLSLKELVK